MIPKIIHYCWFGGKPLPVLAQKCINSWKKYCPDYEIKEWNETNFDVLGCDFTKEAFEAKKWAFLSDYARLSIIFQEGGIYLDTDVELLKSLDFILKHKCFFAEETTGFVNTGLGFGAEKGNSIIKKLLQEYEGKHFLLPDGTFDLTPCPKKNTRPLFQYGYHFSGETIWKGENIVIYPPEYFCPMDCDTRKLEVTENTISIHHFEASWHTKLDKLIERIEKGEKKSKIYKIKRMISFPFRVVNKVRMLGIRQTLCFIREKMR